MRQKRIVVIGAGMGGLAAAIRLAARGCAVTLVEALATPGGKMRAMPSPAGPVDAGPTVLTLRQVFDDLFALGGRPAGGSPDASAAAGPGPPLVAGRQPPRPDRRPRRRTLPAIAAFAGAREAAAFRRFDQLAKALHQAFDAPGDAGRQAQTWRAIARPPCAARRFGRRFCPACHLAALLAPAVPRPAPCAAFRALCHLCRRQARRMRPASWP